jgi:uncharacterized membrane protein YcaP (DUF421 family)
MVHVSSWLTASGTQLGIAAGKAALMYATALVALRLGERRTLAQWTLIDFAVAVAIGAIIGRTATASNQAYAIGLVAVAVLIAVHRITSLARFRPLLRRLTDHRVRVLVVDGQLRRGQLLLCGITEDDVLTELRQNGVLSLSQVRYLLFEVKGGLTIVRKDDGPGGDALEAGLRSAVNYSGAD